MTYLEKINRLLLLNGKTKDWLANQLGISRSKVFNYFNGKSDLEVKNLIKIADLFGVSPCYFFDCGSQTVNNSGVVSGSNVEIKQIINHNHELEVENEKLKAELEGCRKLLEEKERLIDTLKQMIEMLKK